MNSDASLDPIQPILDWEKPTTEFEKYCTYIPVIGSAIHGTLQRSRYKKCIRTVRDKLRKRKICDPSSWDEDDEKSFVAEQLCDALTTSFVWPRSKFIPADAFEPLLRAPLDDLEITEFFGRLEFTLHIQLTDDQIDNLVKEKSLHQVIDLLCSHRKLRCDDSGFP